MGGRFFRSFSEAEMGVIQVNTSKNKNCTCKIWRFQGKPLPLQCSVIVWAVVMTAFAFSFIFYPPILILHQIVCNEICVLP